MSPTALHPTIHACMVQQKEQEVTKTWKIPSSQSTHRTDGLCFPDRGISLRSRPVFFQPVVHSLSRKRRVLTLDWT